MDIDKHRCPVEQALELVGGQWKTLILWRLSAGTLRFGELQQTLPQVTQRVLTLQLRELERAGLVQRKVYPEVPLKVEYALTALGRTVLPVLESLGKWLQDHAAELSAVAAIKPALEETPFEQLVRASPSSRIRH